MGNEVAIILVVGIAAVGIAYFANFLCQPSGNAICWPPSQTSLLPQEPIEDKEQATEFIPQLVKAIGGDVGMGPPEVATAPEQGRVIDFGKQFEALRKATTAPGGGGAGPHASPKHLQMMTKNCKAKYGPSQCWSDGMGRCVPCGNAAKMGAVDYNNFAEAEGYYVRVA